MSKHLLFLYEPGSRAMTGRVDFRDRHLIGVIGDQDTVTGMLLAGVGNVDTRQKKNFFIVESKTPIESVEAAFKELTGRKDLAILLINQHVADMMRHLIEDYHQMMPALLEIPSKDHPYDPEKDSILKRVNRLFSND